MTRHRNYILLLIFLISCSPKTSSEYCKLGFKQKGNKAENSFKKAIELDSLNAKAYYGLGGLQMNSADTNKTKISIKYLLKSLSIDSSLSDSYNRIGYIYLQDAYKYKSGMIYSDGNKLQNAIKYFSKAIQTDSSVALYYYQRGFSYDLLGDTINSKKDFNKCCSLGFMTTVVCKKFKTEKK